MAIEEGRAAPDFTLEDGDGKRVSLDDYRGQYVVVYFYPRDDTPGCTKEACGFRDLHDSIRARGAEVLGISRTTGRPTGSSRKSTTSPSPCSAIRSARSWSATARGARR